MLILVFKKSMTIFYIRNEKSNLRAFKNLDCVINIKLRIFFLNATADIHVLFTIESSCLLCNAFKLLARSECKYWFDQILVHDLSELFNTLTLYLSR